MTVSVKPCIFNHLCVGILCPSLLEELNVLKDDLGNKQLGLPVILAIHALSIPRDVSDTVVIFYCQVFQVPQQIVLFHLESVDVCPQIFRFMIDLHLFSSYQFQLIADEVDFLLSHDLLPVYLIQIHDLGSQVLVQIVFVKIEILLLSSNISSFPTGLYSLDFLFFQSTIKFNIV